ncbi:hypothetical protein BH18ACI4_BH18ACI4_04560 [soil metagenome]
MELLSEAVKDLRIKQVASESRQRAFRPTIISRFRSLIAHTHPKNLAIIYFVKLLKV